MIKSLLTEYKLPWIINRSLYSSKLKAIRHSRFLEDSFEKKVEVQRVFKMDMDAKKLEEFLGNLSDNNRKEILKTADKALKGKIKAFNSIDLDYGYPLQWNYNPLSKVHIDANQKWFNIPDFDPVRGDIKVIWEASRFSHFLYFARAFLITKNKKYYEGFSEQLENWLNENDYTYGANFKCGQEATLRMLNALLAYTVFEQYKICDEKDEENMKKLIQTSYQKVLSNFFYAEKCIKNNHTISEICGIIIGSWCCSDNKGLKKAYEKLDNEIAKQFSSDGGYLQNSFNYQRLALQVVEFVLSTSRITNIELSNDSKKIILNSAYLLYQMQTENGQLPNRGANDGSLIFPVTSCNYNDFRPIINSISCLIKNERLYKDGDYDEEVIWFTNKKPSVFQRTPIEKVSSSFFGAGLFSLRNSENSFLMTVLKNHKTRPGHMDQLHIDVWHKGVNILCDAGSYSYADSLGKSLSLTAAHNTVKVENVEQMNKRGAFLVTDWSRSKDVQFGNDFFEGTVVSQNGYSHTRRIDKNSEGYLVKDTVNYSENSSCEFNLHTPCDVKIVDNGFQLLYENTIICTVETNGSIELKKSYRSLFYYKKEEIQCISIKKKFEDKQCLHSYKIYLPKTT